MGRISQDKQVSSQDKLFGAHTIIHEGEPYMTRFWFWRFRVHIFHFSPNGVLSAARISC